MQADPGCPVRYPENRPNLSTVFLLVVLVEASFLLLDEVIRFYALLVQVFHVEGQQPKAIFKSMTQNCYLLEFKFNACKLEFYQENINQVSSLCKGKTRYDKTAVMCLERKWAPTSYPAL